MKLAVLLLTATITITLYALPRREQRPLSVQPPAGKGRGDTQ